MIVIFDLFDAVVKPWNEK